MSNLYVNVGFMFLSRNAVLARYMLSSCVRPSARLFVCLPSVVG